MKTLPSSETLPSVLHYSNMECSIRASNTPGVTGRTSKFTTYSRVHFFWDFVSNLKTFPILKSFVKINLKSIEGNELFRIFCGLFLQLKLILPYKCNFMYQICLGTQIYGFLVVYLLYKKIS